MAMLNEIKTSQDALRQSVDQRITNFERNMKDWMSHELANFKANIGLDIEEMNKKIDMLEKKLENMEQIALHEEGEAFSPALTVVAINLQETRNENLKDKVTAMIEQGLGLNDIKPARVLRLESKNEKPGLVKIQCFNKDEKIAILRAKQNLKDCRPYKRVFLRSSMTHSERLIRINFNTLLREMPNGRKFRLAGNGRIVRNEGDTEGRDGSNSNANRMEHGESSNNRTEETEIENRESRGSTRGVYRARGRGRGRGQYNRTYSRTNHNDDSDV
jgi:hypothetical protein